MRILIRISKKINKTFFQTIGIKLKILQDMLTLTNFSVTITDFDNDLNP